MPLHMATSFFSPAPKKGSADSELCKIMWVKQKFDLRGCELWKTQPSIAPCPHKYISTYTFPVKRGGWGKRWDRRCHRPSLMLSLHVYTTLGTERKVNICARASVRKLFTSPSLKLPGEEQGSARVVRLSDDNKAAQPKHATSSNARLLPLFWENKEKNKTFPGMLLPSLKVSPNCTSARASRSYSPMNTQTHCPPKDMEASSNWKGEGWEE